MLAILSSGVFGASAAVGSAGVLVTYDIVVYGGTSAGVIAAVQSARMGKSVVLIEPTHRLGGMTTGGLGATDTGKRTAIGGLALEFYQRVDRKYRAESAWRFQQRHEYLAANPTTRTEGTGTMWAFEPKVALEVFSDMIREAGVTVCYKERLDLAHGVRKQGARIAAITMESGRVFRGLMFIDASYEGDLVAKAGISYVVGREPSAQYGESLNGITTQYIYPHERRDEIDAYVIPGNPKSGLLPTVRAKVAADGSGDRGIMASCFRMCLTNAAENRLPVERPATYEEKNYELLLRSIEAGRTSKFFSLTAMPNHKTDCNSTEPFSTNFVGMNHAYPDGDHAVRERIIREHRDYQLGFLWTMQHHPRVPETIRTAMLEWGLPKDEFTDSSNWSPQLYIREGRRMVGSFVMQQSHCESLATVPQPIGLASYTIDSHYVQRFVSPEGKVKHEGYFDRRVKPYGVALGSILPVKTECENLTVPVCLSASHVAYGSIRMEPVFMILGQAAATIAAQAIDGKTAVQDLSYPELRNRLIADKQVLQ